MEGGETHCSNLLSGSPSPSPVFCVRGGFRFTFPVRLRQSVCIATLRDNVLPGNPPETWKCEVLAALLCGVASACVIFYFIARCVSGKSFSLLCVRLDAERNFGGCSSFICPQIRAEFRLRSVSNAARSASTIQRPCIE